MALNKKEQTTKRTTRRPPPNYFSRPVQRRLFLAVGCLMLVLILMAEARKPQNWQWMWAGQARGEKQIDTRLPDKAPVLDPPGTVYANSDQVAFENLMLDVNNALPSFRTMGWEYCLGRLDRDERWALDRILKASRQPATMNQVEGGPSQRVLKRLDDSWTNYFNQANRDVFSSPIEQSQVWVNALMVLEIEWKRKLKPALRAVLDQRPQTELERKQLARLQRVIDGLGLAAIQDNTVWRAAEQHAWFRLLEQLQETELGELRRSSAGPTSFVQLFRQPAEYRGKLVTVRGRAKLGYRVRAPQNIHGIQHYTIFWLQPNGGQNSPFVVYSLETPQGFPTIKDKDLEGETTALNEEVAFDGYFFKRWAYRAKDGVNTAPLLLAKAPVWQPPTDRVARRPYPGKLMTTLSVVGVLGISIGLAYLAYAASNRPAAGVLDRHRTSQLASFGDQELSRLPQSDVGDEETSCS